VCHWMSLDVPAGDAFSGFRFARAFVLLLCACEYKLGVLFGPILRVHMTQITRVFNSMIMAMWYSILRNIPMMSPISLYLPNLWLRQTPLQVTHFLVSVSHVHLCRFFLRVNTIWACYLAYSAGARDTDDLGVQQHDCVQRHGGDEFHIGGTDFDCDGVIGSFF